MASYETVCGPACLNTKKITVCCMRYNIIVICKQENYTIIDKIQPSISRTKIKGTLVFNEGGGGGYSDIFIHIKAPVIFGGKKF